MLAPFPREQHPLLINTLSITLRCHVLTRARWCYRRKEESDKNYFEGTGYARIPTQPHAPFPTFSQVVQTTVDRGLLFFAENQVIYNKHLTTSKYVHSTEQPGVPGYYKQPIRSERPGAHGTCVLSRGPVLLSLVVGRCVVIIIRQVIRNVRAGYQMWERSPLFPFDSHCQLHSLGTSICLIIYFA